VGCCTCFVTNSQWGRTERRRQMVSTCGSYSIYPGFKSRSADRLSSLWFFVVFSASPAKWRDRISKDMTVSFQTRSNSSITLLFDVIYGLPKRSLITSFLRTENSVSHLHNLDPIRIIAYTWFWCLHESLVVSCHCHSLLYMTLKSEFIEFLRSGPPCNLSIYLSIYLSVALQPFVGAWPLFQFLDFYTVGRTPWTADQSVARPLPAHRTAQIQNKYTLTYMP
jgi:hypothetical protein